MSQLYARVFVQILDSSIAEDFMLRHVFEDFLKLCDFRTGVVDMTRQALSRRLNIPLELLNQQIGRLEQPDPHSRDQDFEGRRIERLDDHRDWGWRILNWAKYDDIRTKAANADRVARHRVKKQIRESTKSFTKPTSEDVLGYFGKIGVPPSQVEPFLDHYEANGWRVGRNPMKDWKASARTWKRNWSKGTFSAPLQKGQPTKTMTDRIVSDLERMTEQALK